MLRLILPLTFGLMIASCDSKGSGSNSSNPPVITKPKPKPPKPQPKPDPDPKPEDEVLRLYEPYFSPLTATMYELKKSDVPIVDDFFRYQQGIALNWDKTRYSDHIPSTYLSLWNPDEILYVDETGGEVKGIEKLEVARLDMLEKFPILSLPEYNAPVEVIWTQLDTKAKGLYKATQIFLGESVEYNPEPEYSTIFYGSLFQTFNQKIWIYGKNSLWDFPKQTVAERAGVSGIDMTLIHEWGHHLSYAIDINLGRSNYQTWQFTESWAETFRYVVFGSRLDKAEILENEYQELLWELGGEHKQLKNPRNPPYSGEQYFILSMEKCIAHEKYHAKFDPNTFLEALIEAYKRIEGRKLDLNPYPVTFLDSGFAQAPWGGAGFKDNRRINKMQPLLVTRAEFLRRFLEVYDCGLANEFIEADIEGMEKFEW